MCENEFGEIGQDNSLLILDNNEPFRRSLARGMEKYGFNPTPLGLVAAGRAFCTVTPPAYAIIDLQLIDGAGFDVIKVLHARRPGAKIIVLTGYDAIVTAVAAVKIGAIDYLAKPADENDVTNALLAKSDGKPPPSEYPMSADRVRWEHIQRVYELCNRNTSDAARRLNMHRRSLQRILAKRSPR